MKIRLLALDLDGTLLGEGGRLGDDSRRAVARAGRAGMRIVICTGRRFRMAEPIARELDLDGPMVVHNGVVVKEIATGRTLHHDYLPWTRCESLVPHLERVGAPLVYIDEWPGDTDILLDRRHRPHDFQHEYLEDNGGHARRVDDLSSAAPAHIVMMSLMGDERALLDLRERTRTLLGPHLRTNLIHNSNYQGHILEFLSAGSSKWTGLEHIAAAAGIPPAEIAAVGDDTNDLEMIQSAGLGIAMGNAPAEVRRAADHTVASNHDGGLPEAIDLVLNTR